MSGHRHDRLAGLGLLLVGGGPGRLATTGVPEAAIDALTAAGVEVTAVIAGFDGSDTAAEYDGSDAAAEYDGSDTAADAALVVLPAGGDLRRIVASLPLAAGAPVLVLRRIGRRPRSPYGYRELARFGGIGSVDSPTHLVRLGRRQVRARSWFAGAVRPAWSRASRIGRQLGRLPIGAGWGFGVLMSIWVPIHARAAAPEVLSRYPGVDGPAVLTFGGGPTAGRVVLTYTGADGRPDRHLKIDPAHRGASLETEIAMLDRLSGAGGVPRGRLLLTNVALTTTEQTHLDGPVLDRRWRTGGAEPWSADVDAVLDWLTRVTVPRGLVHGDLWPSNVIAGPDGIGVIDWESGAAGDPLLDALGFLITAARSQQPGATLTDAGLAVLDADGWAAARTPRRLAPFLAGEASDPVGVEARIVDRLTAIAEAAAPGGSVEEARRADWLAARDAVADAWRAGRSPWRAVGLERSGAATD